MKRQAQFIALVCLFAGGCWLAMSARVSAQADDPRITKIFADWKKRQDAIKTVHYRLEGQFLVPKGSCLDEMLRPLPNQTPAQDIMGKIKRNLLLDFAKGRCRLEIDEQEYDQETNKLHPVVKIKTFNGEVGKQWRPRERNTHPLTGLQPTTAEFAVGRGYFGGAIISMNWWPLFIGHGSVPWPDKGNITLAKLMVQPECEMLYVHGEAVHQGRTCWVVRSHARKSLVTSFIELWVDKGRDSAILRYDYYMNNIVHMDFEVNYQKTTHGWLPKRWSNTERSPNNKGKIRYSETMTVVELYLDQGAKDTQFDIEFKTGMLVADITYHPPGPGQSPGRTKSERKLLQVENDGQQQEVEIVDGIVRKVGRPLLIFWLGPLILILLALALLLFRSHGKRSFKARTGRGNCAAFRS